MSKQLGLAGALVATLAFSACVSPDAYRELQASNDALQRNIADLDRHQKELEAENQRLRGEVDRLGKNAVAADYVAKRRAELDRLISEFQKGGRRAIPGVTVRNTREGVAFDVQGEILFESGKADVTESGKDVLRKLLPELRAHVDAGHQLRVDGHTDTDPIVHSQWKTNLRLSSERAMGVLQFLRSNGLDPSRMHVAAFGQYRPAVEGDSPEAKRANRRVEIVMLRE